MAQHTALIEVHKELGAKMAPVNNWDLPLFYPGGTSLNTAIAAKPPG